MPWGYEEAAMLSARAAIRDVTWALRWGTSPHRRTLRTSPPGNRYPKSVPNTAGNSLWGRSPSFSFWLAICWVSLGFAVGSYKTCGHAADQSQSCVCTRPLHKLAFCSLGRREAFFKGFPCVLWSIWDWKCPLLVLALENCEKKGWQYRPAICRPIVCMYFTPCSPCHV